ncbi:MAG: hypothetical protein IT198_13875 [Acidimicrobiia bacterium]|nr:hypothetical protein [Acidimicrobiia bacterium]
MSWPSYAAALLILVLQTAPVVVSASYAARVLVDPDRPLLRVGTGLLVAFVEILVALQAVGAAGFLSRWPVLVAAWLVAGLGGVAAYAIARHRGPRVEPAAAETAATAVDTDPARAVGPMPPTGTGSRTARYVWLGTIVVLTGAFVTALVSGLVKPSFSTDTVNYHLPAIANWIRDHSIWTMRQWQFSVFQNGYPMNSELIAAWFVIPFGRDFLVNLAPLAQAVFAAVAIGALAEQLGLRARDAVLVGAAGLFIPIVSTPALGAVGSDLLPMAGWALALTYVLRWRDTESGLDVGLAGLTLGLALGAKITGTVYVAVFGASILVLVLWRRRWLQGLVILPLAVAAPALVWFMRNWVLEGNPLWAFDVLGFRAGYWRDNGDDWSVWEYVVRGGPAAWVRVTIDYVVGLFCLAPLLVFGVPGFLRTLRAFGSRFDRARVWLLCGMPVLALALTLAMPWTGGNDGYNVPASGRYVAGSFAILLAAAMAGALRGRRSDVWRVALLVALATNVAVSFLSPLLPGFRMSTRGLAAGAVAACAVGLVLLLRDRGGRGDHASRIPRVATVLTATVLVMLLAVVSAPAWSANWYRSMSVPGLGRLYRDVQDRPISKSRIAVAGLAQTYPLYGRDLSNEVVWVGADDIGSPWVRSDRDGWLDALEESCTDYVVVFDDPTHWLSPVIERAFVRGRLQGLEPVFETTTPVEGKDRHLGLYRVADLPAYC